MLKTNVFLVELKQFFVSLKTFIISLEKLETLKTPDCFTRVLNFIFNIIIKTKIVNCFEFRLKREHFKTSILLSVYCTQAFRNILGWFYQLNKFDSIYNIFTHNYCKFHKNIRHKKTAVIFLIYIYIYLLVTKRRRR